MATVSSLDIPARVKTVLHKHGIQDTEHLVRFCRRELRDLRGIGPASLDAIESAVTDLGLSLAVDPWAPYVCARHGRASRDTSLVSFFLCDACAGKFSSNAFRGKEPEYEGNAVTGHCLHCNQQLDNIRLRQWFLCRVCDRVVRSIGRSVVADEYAMRWWRQSVKPSFPHLHLRLTDPPTLQPRDPRQAQSNRAEVDFTCVDTRVRLPVFGIELKTGRSRISGTSIGSKMGQFQLDNSDCDDIVDVVSRDGLPVYLAHAQVIDRADPPTVHYAAVGLWWTDLFSMREHFTESRRRPRETRIAAYYDTAMFREMEEFVEHLRQEGPRHVAARIEAEGIPQLYY